MAIEFHCEHCNHLIKAAAANAGQTGKCPYCGVETYIPRPVEEDGELPLAPLDEEFEQHRREAAMEDAAYQRKLLEDRAEPGEKAQRKKQPVAEAASAKPEKGSLKQVTKLVVQYLEAMSAGQLDRAAVFIRELSKSKAQLPPILEDLEIGDLTGYGLPAMPRPVLLGFLKQLRAKL